MTAPTCPLTLPHLAFTAGTEAAQAAAAFEQRFGQPPAQIVEVTGRLWAGPVPQPPQDAQP